MDGLRNTVPDSSPTGGSQFHYLASSLARLLEAVSRELERDREAAKASLATASTILQSEIERHLGAHGSRPGALAGWQITRVRTQAFGEPPHAYVVRRRLEMACHLMITSTDSLSEIALSVGFSDQAHLCRLFRQAFGDSPSSWRREREVP